jgi:hypothetical protein
VILWEGGGRRAGSAQRRRNGSAGAASSHTQRTEGAAKVRKGRGADTAAGVAEAG